MAFGCPANSPNWMKLGDVLVSGGTGNKWIKTFIDIMPDGNIHAIAIGPDCDPIFSSNVIYYYFDDSHLIDSASIDLQITEVNHHCNQNFKLAVPTNPEFDYQWFLEGIALVGETSPHIDTTLWRRRLLSSSYCFRI